MRTRHRYNTISVHKYLALNPPPEPYTTARRLPAWVFLEILVHFHPVEVDNAGDSEGFGEGYCRQPGLVVVAINQGKPPETHNWNHHQYRGNEVDEKRDLIRKRFATMWHFWIGEASDWITDIHADGPQGRWNRHEVA